MTFYRSGFTLVLDAPGRAPHLRLVIDDDVDATVELTLSDRVVGRVSTPGDDASRGVVRVRCLDVPPSAVESGYDGLRVRPTRGDKSCFGGVWPVEDCDDVPAVRRKPLSGG